MSYQDLSELPEYSQVALIENTDNSPDQDVEQPQELGDISSEDILESL